MSITRAQFAAIAAALVFHFVGFSIVSGQADRAQVPAVNLPASSLHAYGTVTPVIVAGDPAGAPPDSPATRVDPNLTTSIFAGVGSVFSDFSPVDGNGALGTGSLIHGFSPGKTDRRDYILTAAHVVDSNGDGAVDVNPADMLFVLNFGGNGTQIIPALEIIIHPDYTSATVNDDIAVVRLASPAPAGVPIYNLLPAFSGLVEVINPVGYGRSGDPIAGYTTSASFFTKRSGLNQADAIIFDDEGGGGSEVFLADFDGPDGTTNQFDIGPPGFNPAFEGTLGNALETTFGPGDSGGPSFLRDFATLNMLLGTDGNPILYGVNTFTAGAAPAYGSLMGGALVPTYAAWIDSVMVPEPASFILLVVGVFGLAASRFRRHFDS